MEYNESEPLIKELLQNGTLTTTQKNYVNIDKLITKCHGLPGLIYFAMQQYTRFRDKLIDEKIIEKIDQIIDKERIRIGKTSYLKIFQMPDLSVLPLKSHDNRKLWQRLFGMQRRGDTYLLINELFGIYQRVIDNSTVRLIEQYERDFISHELISSLCKKNQINYIPINADIDGKDDSYSSATASSYRNNFNNNNSNYSPNVTLVTSKSSGIDEKLDVLAHDDESKTGGSDNQQQQSNGDNNNNRVD